VHGDALESQQPPAPPELSLLPSATCVRRRVWLKNAAGFTYGYAVSWWDAEVYRRTMPDPSRPIGASMATAHLDVHREIYATFQCSARRCPKLAERFGVAAESCDCDAAAAAAKEWAEERRAADLRRGDDARRRGGRRSHWARPSCAAVDPCPRVHALHRLVPILHDVARWRTASTDLRGVFSRCAGLSRPLRAITQ